MWWNVLLGVVLVPAAATIAIRLRGRDASALCAGHAAQCLAVVGFVALAQVWPVAMLLALAVSLVVQVVRGDGGCEFLAIPNWLLRRNDRLFCLMFTPVDAFEARRRTSSAVHAVTPAPRALPHDVQYAPDSPSDDVETAFPPGPRDNAITPSMHIDGACRPPTWSH